MNLVLVLLSLFSLILGASAQVQCGREAGGAVCPNNFCCSRWGYCGETEAYCGDGCQSQCRPGGTPTPTPPPPPPSTPTPTPPTPPSPSGDLRSLIPESLFNEMLKHRSDPACQGGFYTYNAFIAAAGSFPDFASVGDSNLRKREIAAFFAQTSHETTGGWPTAPDGPFAWGYCFIKEVGNPGEYCQPDPQWPCAPNRKYFGRGPIQISWNYNYGQAGKALGLDLLNNPDLVSSNPTISFKTALWFWMTPQSPKPSSHDVITGRWTPSDADKAAGRVPGFGVITNIINGGLECGHGPDDRVANRIGFYRRYCNLLGVTPGDNLDCYNQRPFGRMAIIKGLAYA
ncbi:Endochitinase [Thalictrum thalictroides]|uniref:Endochitinase n=1 Tax=Thalictrum thalictroides TaxID=46969 RepID=A0A7J6VUM6_THATH|nr:Endochitinase [Thalictrum thalictroides]